MKRVKGRAEEPQGTEQSCGQGEQYGHAPYRGGRAGPCAASFKARGEEAFVRRLGLVAGAPLPPPQGQRDVANDFSRRQEKCTRRSVQEPMVLLLAAGPS